MDPVHILFIISLIAGLYMAWTIGANDVANAMGTSVGSRALTLTYAVIVAAVFEFTGAFFVGARVTSTVAEGMIDMNMLVGRETELAIGMVAALIASAIWLHFATHLGWPVSTTHSIVGGVVGFGMVAIGISGVNWPAVGRIALSWVISPVAGALLAMGIYLLVVLPIYRSDEPARKVRRIVPPAAGAVFFCLCLSMVYKGLKNLNMHLGLWQALLLALAVGLTAAGITYLLIRRRQLSDNISYFAKVKQTEPIFAILQVITASYMAFAHGANDVANAIGPLAAVTAVYHGALLGSEVTVPLWILAVGGVGIVLGLSTFGYRVIATVGRKITDITPSRGFAAEFGCATTVLVCSKMGLPISTTHTLVGAVIGVGLVRGLRSLDLRIIRDIGLSWVATIPFVAVFTILLYYGLGYIL
jgi:inorganic phosphate transporter, PiT family